MGLLIVRMQAVGPYPRTAAWVGSRPPHHPPRPTLVYNVHVNSVLTHFGSREYTITRLLSHAQMAHKELSEMNIDLIAGMLPFNEAAVVRAKHYERLQDLNTFIAVLRSPETRYLVGESQLE